MSNLNAAGTRRIVTFVDEQGKSRFLASDEAPRISDFTATPGMRSSILWATDATPALPCKPNDPVPGLAGFHPTPGGSTFLILTLPPDAVYAAPDFDPVAAAAEQLRLSPGIADRMEPDAPGFHTTSTIDYVILLSGEVWLALDEEERRLAPGDTVIQIGARHAWQNRSNEPATLAVVLLGAAGA